MLSNFLFTYFTTGLIFGVLILIVPFMYRECLFTSDSDSFFKMLLIFFMIILIWPAFLIELIIKYIQYEDNAAKRERQYKKAYNKLNKQWKKIGSEQNPIFVLSHEFLIYASNLYTYDLPRVTTIDKYHVVFSWERIIHDHILFLTISITNRDIIISFYNEYEETSILGTYNIYINNTNAIFEIIANELSKFYDYQY